MVKKMLLLILLSFSLAGGGFWALKAQDPPPAKPSQVRTDPPTVTATQTVPTDFSGTYAGTFKCEAAGLTGDTTLTINGNEFTTADGKTGRIVTSTTRGYTAVALQVAGTDPAAAPTVISLRGRKSGSRLTLTSVPGAAQSCSFVTSRSMARNRKTPKTPAATGAEVSNPAAVPAAVPSAVPTESPMPSQTPAPSPTPSASPTPTPSPEPVPNPTPSPGEPVPSPTPSPGEPVPSPTPSPTPTPSPSPNPR